MDPENAPTGPRDRCLVSCLRKGSLSGRCATLCSRFGKEARLLRAGRREGRRGRVAPALRLNSPSPPEVASSGRGEACPCSQSLLGEGIPSLACSLVPGFPRRLLQGVTHVRYGNQEQRDPDRRGQERPFGRCLEVGRPARRSPRGSGWWAASRSDQSRPQGRGVARPHGRAGRGQEGRDGLLRRRVEREAEEVRRNVRGQPRHDLDRCGEGLRQHDREAAEGIQVTRCLQEALQHS